MGIERMSLVQIIGSVSLLDQSIMKCCESEIFHVETPNKHMGFAPLQENNPYIDDYRLIQEILNDLSIEKAYCDYASLDMNRDSIRQYLDKVQQDVAETRRYQEHLKGRLANHRMALVQVKHLAGLDLCIADMMRSENATVRFGKIPIDNFVKLTYFQNHSFFFFDFDRDEHYYWGFYVAPNSEIETVDRIFDSLYYEQIDVSEYEHATPQEAIDALQTQIEIEQLTIRNSEHEMSVYRDQHQRVLQQVYCKQKALHDTFAYRKYAIASHHRFCLQGFVPTRYAGEFVAAFSELDQVLCEQLAVTPNMPQNPPVKLTTSRFFKPFEMLISMYGLPSYHAFNPTGFIGLIFVCLFGIMFGDVGQGAGVIVAGLVIWKTKQNAIGKILMRCGLFSMFFGLIYGSFFGVEGSFHPLWHSVGLGDVFPLNVLDSSTSLTILLLSLGLGVIIILVSMMMNITLKLRRRDIAGALFSSNGIAGLLFYAGMISMVLLMLWANVNLLHPLFVIPALVVPLVLMFFEKPLEYTIKQHSKKAKDVEKPTMHLADNIFELIEVLLGYCTNTLSFLRVGGFVLSHAALMLVVMTFAHMAGSGGMIVLILGNLFVMILEGLLVSIQIIRLTYYEMFSRFYESGGEEYHPIKIQYDAAQDHGLSE